MPKKNTTRNVRSKYSDYTEAQLVELVHAGKLSWERAVEIIGERHLNDSLEELARQSSGGREGASDWFSTPRD